MIKTALDTSAPFFVGAGICGSPILAQAGINGITDSELGKSLLVIMALAVIVNQVWTVVEKIIDRIKTKPADLTGLAGLEVCEMRHKSIESDLKAIREDNVRQDHAAFKQFATIEAAIGGLRKEMREDINGMHRRTDDILRAVSRVEGKVSQ
jgi:hypothetical protein